MYGSLKFKLPKPEKKKCAIYLRVSSLVQKEEGHGLDVQLDVCTEMAEYKDYEIYKVYRDEGVSGTKKPSEREAMSLLLSDGKEHKFTTIIFYSLDRLSRDNYFTLGLIKDFESIGIEVISCKESIDTATYQGKFKIGMFSLIAELELNVIKHRLQMGRQAKKISKGDIGGKMPYGYSRSPKSEEGIVINDQEIIIVKYIFKLLDEGYSMNKISILLNESNTKPPKKGKKWYCSSVKVIVDNREKYEGGLINDNQNEIRWPSVLNI